MNVAQLDVSEAIGLGDDRIVGRVEDHIAFDAIGVRCEAGHYDDSGVVLGHNGSDIDPGKSDPVDARRARPQSGSSDGNKGTGRTRRWRHIIDVTSLGVGPAFEQSDHCAGVGDKDDIASIAGRACASSDPHKEVGLLVDGGGHPAERHRHDLGSLAPEVVAIDEDGCARDALLGLKRGDDTVAVVLEGINLGDILASVGKEDGHITEGVGQRVVGSDVDHQLT